MNDELNTEIIEVHDDTVSDPETLVQGSETVNVLETEVETEVETELETEVETETEIETEVYNETEVDTEFDTEELKDIKESLENNNNSVQELTNFLLQSEPAETIDYTESLSVIYQGLLYENNNFCLGVESLLLGIGILSGIIFGFVFRSIFKR